MKGRIEWVVHLGVAANQAGQDQVHLHQRVRRARGPRHRGGRSSRPASARESEDDHATHHGGQRAAERSAQGRSGLPGRFQLGRHPREKTVGRLWFRAEPVRHWPASTREDDERHEPSGRGARSPKYRFDALDWPAERIRLCRDLVDCGVCCRASECVVARATGGGDLRVRVRVASNRNTRGDSRPRLDNISGRLGDRGEHFPDHRHPPCLDARRRRR